MRKTYVAEQSVGLSYQQTIGSSGQNLYYRTSDPGIFLLTLIKGWKVAASEHRVVSNDSTPRNRVYQHSSLLNSLWSFLDVLSRQSAPVNQRYFRPRWTPRLAYIRGGFLLRGYSAKAVTLGSLTSGYDNSDAGAFIKAYVLLVYQKTGQPNVITFDTVHRFFLAMYRKLGPSFNLTRTWSANDIHRLFIRNLTVSDYTVSYEVELQGDHFSTPGTGGIAFYGIRYSLDEQNPFRGTCEITYFRLYAMFGYQPSGPQLASTDAKLYTTSDVVRDVARFYDSYIPPIGVSDFISGLYMSQGQAVKTLLGNMSRNFETLAESPELRTALSELVEATRRRKGLLRKISAALLGSYFLFIFALKPTYETVADVWKNGPGHLKFTLGRASVTFYSTSPTLADLPPALRGLLLKLDSSPAEVRVTVRTQVRHHITKEAWGIFTSALFERCAQLGFVPEPLMLWNALPMSFIVDEYIPIGRTIDLLQSYVTASTLKNTEFGHSVSVAITSRSGHYQELFLRSDPIRYTIDPPRDVWLTPQGGQASIIIPLVIQACL